MELKIIRIKSNTNFTEGKLYINGFYFCDTLEDKDRGLYQYMSLAEIKAVKVYGETCIPYGRYKVILSMSKRFGKVMPELLSVKGFVGTRIHSGNTIYDTEGCILVGTKLSEGAITNSRKTFNSLMSILKTQKSISLIIE